MEIYRQEEAKGSPGPHLSAMQETQVVSVGQEVSLEKEKAIHSRSLTWRIPCMEEPGRLQSRGAQRVGHD